MNFAKKGSGKRSRIMQAGDLVIIYERHDSLDHLYLHPGRIFNNKFGTFYHDDMIGKPFGSKIHCKHTSGWVYILEPTPELWSGAVRTRTQIVNEVDSSVVVLMLDLFPGCKVIETGTGSGCMSLAIARCVAPTGHVYSYEYNAVRAETAKEEFKKLRVDHLITVQCRDVCGKYVEGHGGFDRSLDNGIDAVFLDLPEPWLALEHAKRALKPGRSICCYSPCIEQVMKTCETLRAMNFHSIRMIEVRQRPFDARPIELDTIDLGLEESIESVNNRSHGDPQAYHHHYKPEHQPKLLTLSDIKPVPITEHLLKKRKATDLETAVTPSTVVQSEEKEEEDMENAKTLKTGESDAVMMMTEEMITTTTTTVSSPMPAAVETEKTADVVLSEEEELQRKLAFQEKINRRIQNQPKTNITGSYEMQVARPLFQMKGHTAFLTFAVRPYDS